MSLDRGRQQFGKSDHRNKGGDQCTETEPCLARRQGIGVAVFVEAKQTVTRPRSSAGTGRKRSRCRMVWVKKNAAVQGQGRQHGETQLRR
jgi:hypothetical protein